MASKDEIAAAEAMANLAITPTKGTAKRDALRANEIEVQQMWEECAAFEANPEESKDRESFMVTFPYPYSNGHLHIGHAFSLTKAIFRAQYERHQGKNVLFPFAFHCTGMPIQAVRTHVWLYAAIPCVVF
jgi:leucyl-tRNA synthetase